MKLRGIYELNNNNIVKESHSDLFWFMWSRTLDNINAGIITNQGICVRYQCVAIEYRANYTGNKLLELIYRDRIYWQDSTNWHNLCICFCGRFLTVSAKLFSFGRFF